MALREINVEGDNENRLRSEI